jgi:hypothetical protein
MPLLQGSRIEIRVVGGRRELESRIFALLGGLNGRGAEELQPYKPTFRRFRNLPGEGFAVLANRGDERFPACLLRLGHDAEARQAAFF